MALIYVGASRFLTVIVPWAVALRPAVGLLVVDDLPAVRVVERDRAAVDGDGRQLGPKGAHDVHLALGSARLALHLHSVRSEVVGAIIADLPGSI